MRIIRAIVQGERDPSVLAKKPLGGSCPACALDRWWHSTGRTDWAERLAGFTLLFEALNIAMCREMTFAAVSRLVGLSWHQVVATCKRYVELGLEQPSRRHRRLDPGAPDQRLP